MQHRRRLAALLAALCVAVSGCARAEAELGEASSDAAEVAPIEGTELARVTLTAQAYDALGIATTAVREAPGSSRVRDNLTAVPAAAVLYDAQGRTWTYTSPQRLTFVRQAVTIARVEGDLALLRAGPAPGTPVVTVGASELLGVESGVGEE